MGKRNKKSAFSQAPAHEREIDRIASMTRAGHLKPELRANRRDQDEMFAIHCRAADQESRGGTWE